MSNAEQNAAKERLLTMLHGLARRDWRDGIAVDRVPDELDQVQLAGDRELELAALERNVTLANQLRLALQRLEHGGYGKCLRCNQRIGSRRLKAVPWASMCLTCQGHAEAEQQETLPTTGPAAPARTNGGTPSLSGWE